ncbi:MAG: PTS system galactitol-specific IIA component [Erysipelotrichaceae bacterium]|nr:MAG: PTS system galactitol-specific IIA [Erysipelotrichaceae bacterium]TXT18340.1 MAG: PTS system galactitol-specific IIA component [Erysipelotrichaceae bacterium]
MSASLFNSSVILLNIEAQNADEALVILAKKLHAEGYVKDTFIQAILDREAEFSTGLPGFGRGVAIPHADPCFVNTSVLAVATLKNPVQFRMMGNHDELIDVEVMFMLALKESHSHMSVLQSLMDVIQNESLLTQIKEAATPEALYALMSAHIA